MNPVKNVQLELFEDPEKEEATKIIKEKSNHSTPSTKKSDSVKSQKSVGAQFRDRQSSWRKEAIKDMCLAD